MSQSLFTEAAITLAWTGNNPGLGDADARHGVELMLAPYRRVYKEDDFEPGLWEAAGKIEDVFEGDTNGVFFWLEGLRQVAEKYEPSGELKRGGLLKGAWFTAPRVAPPNRVQQCMKDVGLYYAGLLAGRFR